MGVAHTVVRYTKTPPSRADLKRLVAALQGPVEDLVRKDSKFKALGLDADTFVGNKTAVVDVLEKHPALMQRPVLWRGDRAIIGRPRDAVRPFLA